MFYGKGKGKFNADIVSKDLYKFYKDKYKENALPYLKWKKVWDDFIDVRMQVLVYNNLEFTMPHRVGVLRVKIGKDVIKIDKLGNVLTKVDFGATNKLWQEMYPNLTPDEIKEVSDKPIVFHTNDITDGKKLYYSWDRYTCNFVNKTLYRIMVIRKWKRELPKKIKTTKKFDYYG